MDNKSNKVLKIILEIKILHLAQLGTDNTFYWQQQVAKARVTNGKG